MLALIRPPHVPQRSTPSRASSRSDLPRRPALRHHLPDPVEQVPVDDRLWASRFGVCPPKWTSPTYSLEVSIFRTPEIVRLIPLPARNSRTSADAGAAGPELERLLSDRHRLGVGLEHAVLALT